MRLALTATCSAKCAAAASPGGVSRPFISPLPASASFCTPVKCPACARAIQRLFFIHFQVFGFGITLVPILSVSYGPDLPSTNCRFSAPLKPGFPANSAMLLSGFRQEKSLGATPAIRTLDPFHPKICLQPAYVITAIALFLISRLRLPFKLRRAAPFTAPPSRSAPSAASQCRPHGAHRGGSGWAP